MEIAIAIFLGLCLSVTGVVAYKAYSKDSEDRTENNKENEK